MDFIKRVIEQGPVFHRREYRADSHLFIGVLAYHLLNAIRVRLNESDIHFSWNKLREILSTHTIVTTSMRTKSDKIVFHIDCNFILFQ